uniref:G-protein coupled receptors family 1 profile domain-containing protein n=1 Tax=Acrobeloides nanus TaxID=290746 RepID=A0A914C890_9BILA
MLYTFFVGYLVPAVLITFFYLSVIIRLRKTVRKSSAQSNPAAQVDRLHTVTQRIVAVVLFYFFCWTPYWTLNIMSQFSLIIVSWSTLTLSSIFFSSHILVCFNSAANPVLYALINRELRQQHLKALMKKRQSVHLATNVAMDFIEKYSQRMGPGGRFSVASVDSQFRFFDERPNMLDMKKFSNNLTLNKPVFDKRSASFSHPSISTETTTPGDNKESMQTSSIISDLKDRSNSALNDLFL